VNESSFLKYLYSQNDWSSCDHITGRYFSSYKKRDSSVFFPLTGPLSVPIVKKHYPWLRRAIKTNFFSLFDKLKV